MARHVITGAAFLCATAAIAPPAGAQTPVDGRIVRVVYEVDARGSTWGFHLAHMKDGRYCVRLGNPGRLNLTIIQRVADICFDPVPAAVDRSQERRFRAIDTSDGKMKTIVSFQKGSIAASADAITLEIITCSRAEGGGGMRCFPNRYVVRMSGQACDTQVTLAGGKARNATCEHYAAQ